MNYVSPYLLLPLRSIEEARLALTAREERSILAPEHGWFLLETLESAKKLKSDACLIFVDSRSLFLFSLVIVPVCKSAEVP